MSQNTVLESHGDLPESAGRAPRAAAFVPTGSAPAGAAPVLDPVRSLTEAWYRQPVVTGPVSRPFDAQYWACWLVAVVFPAVVAYLLLTR